MKRIKHIEEIFHGRPFPAIIEQHRKHCKGSIHLDAPSIQQEIFQQKQQLLDGLPLIQQIIA